MKHHGDVFARFDDLVEIADRPLADGARQGTIDPDRLAALEQIASDQIGGREVIVAGNGIERPAEPSGHMGDEAGLAAACRTLKEHRQAVGIGSGENFAFIALGQVEGGVSRPLQFQGSMHVHHSAGTCCRAGQARSLHGAAR